LDTLALLNARNLRVISNCKSDKEGRRSFREKTEKRGRIAFERDDGFYKNET